MKKHLKSTEALYGVMRLVFIQVILILGVATTVSANKTDTRDILRKEVSLSVKQKEIKEILSMLEEKIGTKFVYSSRTLSHRKITVDIANKPLLEALEILFKPMQISSKVIAGQVVINIESAPTERLNFVTPAAQTDEKTISGQVRDEKDVPLPGVSVVIKNTQRGTLTDTEGRYSLTIPYGDSTLLFSFVGYVSQQITVGDRSIIDIRLMPDTKALEEVVVVGYGTQRKSDVTGSISVATAAEILKSPSFNALQALKGKVSGVNIFNNTGNPLGINESSQRVVIRGMNSINTSTDPLYVVDGVQMSNIQFVNPNDIERIEVLKDASATAIYGARGANGVILVTTKRGATGQQGTLISYSGWVNVGTIAKKVNVMNSSEFMQMMDRAFQNIGKYPQGESYLRNNGITELLVNKTDPLLFDSNGKPLYDTNWQEEATRNSWSHSHQLNIQQQASNSSFGAFFNYTDQQGILINNFAKRVSGRLAYDAKPLKWLGFSTNVMVNHMWGNGIDDSGGGLTARRTIWEMLPILPVKFPDGSWSTSQFTGNKLNIAQEAMTNPVHELTERKRTRNRTKIFGNFGIKTALAEGLDLHTQLGIDANIMTNKDYIPNNMINISTRGSAGISNVQSIYWQEETYLNYTKSIGQKHRINGTLGTSWSGFNSSSFGTGTVQDFTDNYFGYDNLSAGTTPSAPTSDTESWTMNSYFIRGSYSLDSKYLLTATVRSDGSSRFGANSKYAFFPSIGLGWVISSESFLKNVNAINNLKLRTSFGRTGNTEISPYTTLATTTAGTTLLNGVRATTNQMARIANPDLEWEKTDQFDVGFELKMFKHRIGIELDYYYKKTSDLLLARPLPFSTGFSSVMDNMGRVDNYGFDFLATSVNVETPNLTWETTFNLNFNKNMIKKLGANNEDILTNPSFLGGNVILRVGESMNAFYGYERYGTWGSHEAEEAAKVSAVPGEAKRSTERKIIGNGMPKITGSFINKIQYKDWDLYVDIQFVTGVDTWQLHYHTAEDRTGYINGLNSILYKGWTEQNQNTMVQQIRHRVYAGHNTTADSHWVADGSYIRGNLLQLGYTLNSRKLNDKGIRSARVSFGVNNAFLIHSKDFTGYDPEGASNTDRFGQNIFFYQYPTSRLFTTSVNFSF
jgi:TonB-linked SusC/RagA family outer membrane protein